MRSQCETCKDTGLIFCPDVAEPVLVKCDRKGCTARHELEQVYGYRPADESVCPVCTGPSDKVPELYESVQVGTITTYVRKCQNRNCAHQWMPQVCEAQIDREIITRLTHQLELSQVLKQQELEVAREDQMELRRFAAALRSEADAMEEELLELREWAKNDTMGMTRRMLELFETRRDSDEQVRLLTAQLEKLREGQ